MNKQLLNIDIYKAIKEKFGCFVLIGLPIGKNYQADVRLKGWIDRQTIKPNIIAREEMSNFFSQGANKLIWFMLENLKSATHILLVSADEVPIREDSLDLMLALDKDIVVGPTPFLYERIIRWNLSHYKIRGCTEPFEPIEYGDLPDKPFRVYESGGPYLIKRKVLENIELPCFKDIWDKKTGIRRISQDLYFCRKADEFKFEIWCEPKAIFEHYKTVGLKELRDKNFEIGTSAYYNRIFKEVEKYKCHYKESPYFYLWGKVVKIIKNISKPKILEVGCGTGQLAHYLYDLGFNNYVGFDFSIKGIQVAESMSSQKFVLGDVNNKTCYNSDYNTVVVTEVLEHLKEESVVFDNLKSGVNFIFTVPSFNDIAHKRFFKNVSEVKERYSKYLDNLNIEVFDKWFIGHGIVK